MMTDPPSASIFLRVGKAARIRVSSVMLKCSSSGTLKSTRTKAFLPLKSNWSIVIERSVCLEYIIIELLTKVRNYIHLAAR